MMRKTKTRHHRLPMALCLICVTAMLLAASPGYALTLFLNNGDRLRGYPVGEVKEGAIVTIAVPQPGGGVIRRSVQPSEIRRMVETVDRKSLQDLNNAGAKEYFNYAEILAERKIDPEARDTAIRLFLIAAYLDKDTARAAFLALIPLARDAEEEKRFRAMAYIHDPAHSEKLLSGETALAARPVSNNAASRDLLQAMQLLRQAKRGEAAALLRRKDVAEAFAAFERVFPQALLNKFLARTGDRLLPYELEAILRVELALEGFDAGPSATRSSSAGWGAAISSGGDEPVQRLQLPSLARRLDPAAKKGEFIDPRKTIYRDGDWFAP